MPQAKIHNSRLMQRLGIDNLSCKNSGCYLADRSILAPKCAMVSMPTTAR